MRVAFPFRFSLRAVGITFVCLAVVLAAVSAPLRQAARQRKIIHDVHALGGLVLFADEFNSVEPGYSQRHRLDENRTWFEKFVGDGYVRRIDWIFLNGRNDIPSELLREIADLPDLKQLDVSPPIAQTPEIERLKLRLPQCQVSAEWNMSNAPVRTLHSNEEFERAIRQGDSVVFIDGGLSINVQLSKPMFAEFAGEWHTQHVASDVRFFRVDYQRSASPAWEAAIQLQLDQGVDLDEIELHGAPGRVLWIHNGVLIRYDQSLRHTTFEDVVHRTEEAFGISMLNDDGA